MFGLTFEKLVLVMIVAGVVIGPQRLPEYARRLAETVRAVRTVLDQTRTRAEQEMGLSLDEARALDLRRYDPRHVVREALREPAATPTGPPAPATGLPEPDVDPAIAAQAARVRPGQVHLVVGDAAHPRRIRIADLPSDDPRRIAAESVGVALLDPDGTALVSRPQES